MVNNKIIVLDNDEGDVKIFNHQGKSGEGIKDYLYEKERIGLMGRVSNCQYMIVYELNIKFI